MSARLLQAFVRQVLARELRAGSVPVLPKDKHKHTRRRESESANHAATSKGKTLKITIAAAVGRVLQHSVKVNDLPYNEGYR